MRTEDGLPEQYAARMKEMLGEEFPAYLACLDRQPFHGIRANTAKLSAEEFCRISPVKTDRPVPWCGDAWYYGGEDRPAKHPYYHAGLYYLQEPSAMLPGALLPVRPGDRILDLCAAPGGKSTQLGCRLGRDGLLVSNDASNSRAKALLKNIELFGIGNILLTNEYSHKLAERFPAAFDAVLVDAPCSGEGMFRRDSAVKTAWERNGPEYFYPIQRTIVRDALAMLRPGGYLLYSTCTFSVREDECVIAELLREFPQLETVAVPQSGGWGFAPGRTDDPQLPGPDDSLRNCMRLYPHRIDGEGHFAALLHLRDGGDGSAPERETGPDRESLRKENSRFLARFPEFAEFLRLVDASLDERGIFAARDSRISLIPPGLPDLTGLRCLRNGLLLGECRKGRFEPSQALAMYLKREEFANTVSFSAADARTVKYLKGETVDCAGADVRGEDGWCLVCTDGYPLGFARRSGERLKNKYFAPWRWL